MKFVLLAVGRMRDRHLSAVCEEYLARVRHHLQIDVVEVADDAALIRRIPSSSSSSSPSSSAAAGGGDIIALEVGGEPWDTVKLTKFVEEGMLRGTRTVTFLIGGSDGLPAGAVARASRSLSLSALTLPHRLARVLLCEQLYRALSIIKGEPYHR